MQASYLISPVLQIMISSCTVLFGMKLVWKNRSGDPHGRLPSPDLAPTELSALFDFAVGPEIEDPGDVQFLQAANTIVSDCRRVC